MSFLAGNRKEDLRSLAVELGEEPSLDIKIPGLKKLIQESENFDESDVKEMLKEIIREREEKERKQEEIEEKRRQEEIEEKRRKEDQELQIRLREMELEKLQGSDIGTPEVMPSFMLYLNMMKGAVEDPPARDDEWPLFFHQVERLFKVYDVPEGYKGRIMLHCLKGHVKTLNAVLELKDLEDYSKIKEALMKEHQITPLQHKKNLEKCFKSSKETFAQYRVRIEAAWDLYLKSREVENFETLKELLVADRIKDELPSQVRSHVLLKEADGWLGVTELVQEIDNFLMSVPPGSQVASRYNGKPEPIHREERFSPRNEVRYERRKEGHFRTAEGQPRYVDRRYSKNWSGNEQSDGGRGLPRCYECNSTGHLKKHCPKLGMVRSTPQRRVNVNQASVEKTVEIAEDCQQRLEDEKGKRETAVVAKVSSFREKPQIEGLCPLKRTKVSVNGKHLDALLDSGAEITVIRADLVRDIPMEGGSFIYIKGIFGPAVKCPLLYVPVGIVLEEGVEVKHQQVLCAVTEVLGEDMLLPPEILNMLTNSEGKAQDPPEIIENSGWPWELDDSKIRLKDDQMDKDGDKPLSKIVSKVELRESRTGGKGEEELEITRKNDAEGEEKDEGLSKTEKFRQDQEDCPHLGEARKLAKQGKGGFYIKDGLLFHRDKILGESVNQLVLPKSRRKEVLDLAHCSVFGGHLGARKTIERIRYSFHWMGMSEEVRRFCSSCADCQMVRGVRQMDRAPISPVARPELPFQIVNIDIIGPIEPASLGRYKYVLCLVDQHTRWAEAVPLTSLSAKTTCEALLTIFMRTGVPAVIASDNGTNFNSQLTREFERLMGASPRFSTPLYPQSNGLVERFNKTLKGMLHHVIRENPKNWHTKIPFVLWAYREVPNRTTGVAPFQLLYGRKPEGPLSILQNVWTGEQKGLQLDTTPIGSYLKKLKAQMEEVAEKAKVTSLIQQEKMASYHNLRSTRKIFEPGDKVIVLIPDSTNKLLACWQGPGVIESKKNEHSYMIKMPDGKVKHVHQNKIREFVVSHNAVNVIFEGDEEFGEVEDFPTEVESDFTKEVNGIPSPNLTSQQEEELKITLKKHRVLFTRTLQPVTVGEHKIELLPGLVRRKPHSYCVPIAYRPEVKRQVEELLELGLLEPSEAEIAYPIVCVAKKDASIRMCVDYRALNMITKVPSYPMKDIQELIFTAGRAQWLTCLDLQRGYYQIKMEENSKPLTAFSTHNGTYQWRVMPFGLSGASGTFQRLMDSVLREHNDYAHAYIDDIIIFSESWDLHILHLNRVLDRLEQFGFSVKLKKCSFASKEIKFLGHNIGGGKHSPDSEKLSAIKQLKRPVTKKDVKSVLGLMGFYRSYIPKYAELALPLTELTKGRKSGEVNWGRKEEESFHKLKNALCTATALSTPACNKPFQVHTDASDYAVGCCLTQIDEKGDYKPIAFASQKLNGSQKNWATIEKEAYAVLFGLKKFDKWLHGNSVEIITDHNPLKYLVQTTPKSPKLTRWALALQRWNYTVTHRPGINHEGADALSRLERGCDNHK